MWMFADDIWMADSYGMWVCVALPLFEIKAMDGWMNEWMAGVEWVDWNVFDVIATVL